MVGAMSFLRHNLVGLTAALLAALAVLFVATASLACDVPIDQGATPMSMSDDGGPCEQETEKAPCEKACLVFCQSLVPPVGGSAPASIHASVRYPLLDARQADFTVEADDPPPRT